MAWLGGGSSGGATAPLSLVRNQGISDGGSRRHPVAEKQGGRHAGLDWLGAGAMASSASVKAAMARQEGAPTAGCLVREVMRYSGLPGSGKAALVLLATGGESQDRAAWFREREPFIFILPRRRASAISMLGREAGPIQGCLAIRSGNAGFPG